MTLLLTGVLTCALVTPALATVPPGGFGFVAFNADGNDDVAFVALTDISGETVYLSDNEASAAGGLSDTNEGILRWDSGVVLAGTVVVLSDLSGSQRTASHGTLTAAEGTVNLAASGDALVAYQGPTPTTPSGWIAAIANDEGHFGDLGATGLLEVGAAVTFSTVNHDGGQYVGFRQGMTSLDQYRALIADPSLWETHPSSGESFLPFDATPFSLGGIVVSTFADLLADDGACSLREAVTTAATGAAPYESDGECTPPAAGPGGAGGPAGIVLQEGTYTLATPLGVTGMLALRGIGAGSTKLAGARINLVSAGRFVMQQLTLDGTSGGNGSCLSYAATDGVIVRDVVFTGCHSSTGGAVFAAGAGRSRFERVRFSGNQATGVGGAVALSATTGGGYAELHQCTFDGNSGTVAALHSHGFTTLVRNSTVYGNDGDLAISAGSASGSLTLDHCTVTGNLASEAVGALGGTTEVTLLHGSVVTAQASGESCGISGGLTSLGHNVLATGCPSGGSGDVVANSATFGPLQNNGGATPTVMPGADSPQLNASDCVDSDGARLTTDQRDVPRPADGCTSGAVQVACGDAVISAGEACDDGNTTLGDGCSPDCLVECGWTCDAAEPSTCATSCGDGKRSVVAEACDDGNTTAGDGCSSTCGIEPGYGCTGACGGLSTCTGDCGDGLLSCGVEPCDDGNMVDGDGCSANCTLEPGWACDQPCGEASTCAKECGDGALQCEGDEVCDDGNNVNGDGCSADCLVESAGAWVCSAVCGELSTCWRCGDGNLDLASAETCDDGNVDPKDGCGPTCKVECGWECATAGGPTECEASCGDGYRAEGVEACDDGNSAGGDGCSGACTIEPGWTCSPQLCDQAFTCVQTCGNQILDGGEECDDGNTVDGDGCSSACTQTCGWKCPTGKSCTHSCGDSMTATGAGGLGEECDDGNSVAGDGCAPDCRVEAGHSCTASCDEASSCLASCGNGLLAAGEACDDGNITNDDGCSATCRLEPGAFAFSEIHRGQPSFVELHNRLDTKIRLVQSHLALLIDDAELIDLSSDCVASDGGRIVIDPDARAVIVLNAGPSESVGDLACVDAAPLAGAGSSVALTSGGAEISAVDLTELGCHLAGASKRSIELVEDAWCLADPAAVFVGSQAGSPGAAGACAEAACDDVDDDCDGVTDEELGCGVCVPSDETAEAATCDDGEDNDCDGRTDCADFACYLAVPCLAADGDGDLTTNGIEALCGTDPEDRNDHPTLDDLKDRDGDGLLGCEDDDDDGDDYSDLLELLCGSDPTDKASVPSPEDVADWDGDGVVDCIDPPPSQTDSSGETGCQLAGGEAPALLFGVLLVLMLTLRRRRGRPS